MVQAGREAERSIRSEKARSGDDRLGADTALRVPPTFLLHQDVLHVQAREARAHLSGPIALPALSARRQEVGVTPVV